jgi:cell division protein FtsB
MKKIKGVYRSIIKYKYIIAGVIVLIYMSFFDVNSFQNHYKLNQIIHKLEKQKSFYLDEIRKDSLALIQLNSDKEHIEKFAREKYLMKRDNEDIFIVVDQKNE